MTMNNMSACGGPFKTENSFVYGHLIQLSLKQDFSPVYFTDSKMIPRKVTQNTIALQKLINCTLLYANFPVYI